MSDIPDFFKQFQSTEPEPPQPDLVTVINQKKSGPHRLSFTLRDWEFLDFLCEHPHATNGELAKIFGVGLAAASARVKRLAEMELVNVEYSHAEDTGEVNSRFISVSYVPPKPWSPNE